MILAGVVRKLWVPFCLQYFCLSDLCLRPRLTRIHAMRCSSLSGTRRSVNAVNGSDVEGSDNPVEATWFEWPS